MKTINIIFILFFLPLPLFSYSQDLVDVTMENLLTAQVNEKNNKDDKELKSSGKKFYKSDDKFDYYKFTSKFGKTYEAKLPRDREKNDFTPYGFVKQPSFVRGGGMINKKEHAFLFFVDGDIYPVPIMLGYRYGLLYWWDIGLDVGGNYGLFQVFFHTKYEVMKSKKSEFFFWSNTLKLGYKKHDIFLNSDLQFDDFSFLSVIKNTFAFRLGKKRDKVIYLDTIFYIDYDLHKTHRRITEYWLVPAMLGFETIIGEYANFFIEVGVMYGITGTELEDNSLLYKKLWFPVFKLGVSFRTGKKTAVYYSRETNPLSRK